MLERLANFGLVDECWRRQAYASQEERDQFRLSKTDAQRDVPICPETVGSPEIAE